MSKWFGVGFTFLSEDKGVKDSFRKLRKELDETDESIDDIGRSSKDSGNDLLSLADKIKVGFAGKAVSKLTEISDAIGKVDEADRNFKTLDGLIRKFEGLGQINDDNRDKAKLLFEQFKKLSMQYGTDQTVLADYIMGLKKANFTFDEIQSRVESATKTMGLFNQSADSAVAFDKLSKRLGLSAIQAEQLKKQILSVGVAVGDPQILDNMEAIQEAVIKSTSFKNLRGKDAQQAILQIAKASALAGKSLGMTNEKASEFVSNIFERLKGSEEVFAKIEAGIGGDTEEFKQLSMALGSAGQAMRLLKSDDVLGFVNAVSTNINKLDGHMRKSVLLRLKEQFGDEFVQLLNANMGKAGKAIRDNIANEKDIAKIREMNELVKFDPDNVKKYVEYTKKGVEFTEAQAKSTQDALNLQLEKEVNKTRMDFLKQRIKFNERLMEKQDGFFFNTLRNYKAMNQLNSGAEKAFFVLKKMGLAGEAGEGAKRASVLGNAIEFATENALELSFIMPAVWKGAKGLFSYGKKSLGWWQKTAEASKLARIQGMKTTGMYMRMAKSIEFLNKPFKKLKVSSKMVTRGLSFALDKKITKGIGFLGKHFRGLTIGSKMYFDLFKSNVVGKVTGFFSKFPGLTKYLKIGGKIIGKLALPLDALISTVASFTDHWDRLKETFSQGDWVDFTLELADTLSDAINNFFLGIPKTIAGAMQGLWDGIFEEGPFWDNFKKSLAEGAKDIPFLGDKIHSYLMSGDKGGGDALRASAKADMSSIPMSGTPLMTRSSVTNNNTTNNGGAFDPTAIMNGVANGMNGAELTLVLKDQGGRTIGKQKSRLNANSNATMR